MSEQVKKELYQTHGDPGFRTFSQKRGALSGVDLVKTSAGRPWVKVPGTHDQWLEVDYYTVPGAPPYLHIICPMCGNSSTISAANKKISYEPNRPLRPELQRELLEQGPKLLNERVAEGFSRFDGTLNVERFSCTWETEPELRRSVGGLGICNWTVVIENNVARKA